jgi:tetratricopeptide (TPR) repeat protein
VASALNRLWPKSAMAWFWAGYAWRDADPERAVHAWRQALLLDPDLYQAHDNLGSHFMKTGSLDQALKAYGAAVLIKPDHASAWNGMGTVLKAQGQIERATEAFTQAVDHDPESHVFLGNLGAAFHDQEKWKEALDCFQRLVALKPDLAAGHVQLAWALVKTREFDKALQQCGLALDLDPKSHTALRARGMAQLGKGQTAQALETWREAISLKPDFYDAHRNIADVLHRARQFEEALPFFESAARSAPADRKAVALLNLGNTYKDLRRIEEAMVAWRKAIEADPEYDRPYLQIGVTHLRDGFVADAIDMLEKAWTLDHEYLHTSRALGKAYLLAERWTDAIDVWKAELQLRPGQPQVLYSMGLAYRKLGKIEEAVETWSELLKTTPNHRRALEALKELEQEERLPR